MTPLILRHFIHHLRADNASRNTVKVYTSSVNAYLTFLHTRHIEPASATREDVARFLAERKGCGLLPSALQAYHKAVKRFHRFLVDAGMASVNPLEKRIRIPLGRRLPKYISQADAVRLIESVSGESPLDLRDRALLEMLYATGLRATELCELKPHQVDAGARTVRLVGKGNREGFVHYGEQAASALSAYLERGRPSLSVGSSDAVWLNCFGGPLKYPGLHRMLRERSRAIGLDVRPHMLRHSFATHLLQRGANLRLIQELMRHENIRSTEIYTHIDTSRLADERRRYHPRG